MDTKEIYVDNWNSFNNISKHICRICSTVTEFLVPIYEGDGAEQDLHSKINKYLPIKVKRTDEFPVSLCFHCADKILSWDKFVSICLESEEKFKKLKGIEINSDNEAGVSDVDGMSIDSDNEPLSVHVNRKSSNQKSEMSCTKKRKLTRKAKDGQNELPVAAIKTEVVDTSYDSCSTNKQETNEESFKCEQCDKICSSAKNLRLHVKKFHKMTQNNEIQKCDICGSIYKTKINLKRHYENEHLKNQVHCPVCRSSINSKKLDIHLRVVHGVKTENEDETKYPCKFCPKSFKNKYVRNSHIRESHLNEPWKCKLCGFEGARAVVKRHKREVHCEKKFPCTVCGVPFKTLHTLKMHMTTHSDLRCFTCELCGMGFKRLNNVRDHMKCHEQKSNQCQICGNFFARKRYLTIHEQTIHNFYADGVVPEEKGFECGTCGAKLKWKKNLLAHMRIHTGEKPYVCKICKKDFICHGSLRSHMAKHGVCTAIEKGLETLISPITHSDLQDIHPQIEMHCF